MYRSLSFPLLLLFITCFAFEFTTLDMAIQDRLYDFSSQQWLLSRHDRVLKFIFYDMIKVLYGLFIVSVAITMLFFRNSERIKAYKKGLIIVLLSTLLVPLTIGVLKEVTNTPCPRNIMHFGGSHPYVTAFEPYPDNFISKGRILCFPAGHASGGFALMSLFFLFKRHRYQVISLGSTATFGWIIGSYKMFIGDHFFSHTLISMEIAWFIIISISYMVESVYNSGNREISVDP